LLCISFFIGGEEHKNRFNNENDKRLIERIVCFLVFRLQHNTNKQNVYSIKTILWIYRLNQTNYFLKYKSHINYTLIWFEYQKMIFWEIETISGRFWGSFYSIRRLYKSGHPFGTFAQIINHWSSGTIGVNRFTDRVWDETKRYTQLESEITSLKTNRIKNHWSIVFIN